jgi:hypothetical protein
VSSDPILTKRQRQKVHDEIMGFIGPSTSDADARTISFVAGQVGRQTREEVEFCRHGVRGRP